jgi:hypothetical protein
MYHIHYPEYNVIQEKVLISHEIYLEYKNMPSATEAQNKRAKDFLKYHTKGKEWFTDQSPLWDAIETGILNCNGIHKCIVTKV